MSEKKRKMKRLRNTSEESNSSSMSSSLTSSSDEETDAKDLKPIKEYLTNRKELASQLFKSVKAEKIRLMLPQILKKVDFNDLEELCATELIGMSKKRIMCVINGQDMLQSSNTEESDGSGPSLEIISDTEWLSEAETNIKVEGANSNNKNVKGLKKKGLKTKLKPKGKGKVMKDGKPAVKVKVEKVKVEGKPKEKEKEGESLLDLLELEMRARAIRALIRKEEDTSSTTLKTAQTNNSTNVASGSGASNNADNNSNVRQANLKEQLEKIDVLMKHGDDEDVYVVINPAPTIELLSSESDGEEHSKRVNQKLVNERNSESEKIKEKEQPDKSKEVDMNKEKNMKQVQDVSKEKDTSKEIGTSKEKDKDEKSKEATTQNKNSNLPASVIESSVDDKAENSNEPPKEIELEEGEIIDNDDDNVVNEEIKAANDPPSPKKIKKIKKNPHIRSRKKNKENNGDSVESIKEKEASNTEKDKTDGKILKIPIVFEEPIEIVESPERKVETEKKLDSKESNVESSSKIDLFDDKSLDIEEIINLDDYPDDMDDLEKSDAATDKSENGKSINLSIKGKDKVASDNKFTRSETWATRYYQQDDVQNVIKESKIQSEIRKRLRERQRQSKMNNSPKLKDQETSQPSPETVIPKPTGSVEEYLALKGLSNETSSDVPEEKIDSTVSSESSKKDELPSSNVNLTTAKDNLILSDDKILEKKGDSPINDIKVVEQPAVIVKKAKLFENVAVVKQIDSPLDENAAVEQLNKVVKSEHLLVDASESCIKRKITPSGDETTIAIKGDVPLNDKKIIVAKQDPEESNKQIKPTKSSNTDKDDLSVNNDKVIEIKDNVTSSVKIESCTNVKEEPITEVQEAELNNSMKESLNDKKVVKEENEGSCKQMEQIGSCILEKNNTSSNSEIAAAVKTELKDSKIDASPLRGDATSPKSDSSEDNIIVKIDSTSSSSLIAPIVELKKEQTEEPASSNLKTSELRPD